jgi:hypothetical protein
LTRACDVVQFKANVLVRGDGHDISLCGTGREK